ncbi:MULTISPECIES: hypothetical protein [Enterococcus]|uniref:Uncharacterized protein n=1 Tax=Enterococcus thailandicus TaxID=417368 RepID=A0A1L8XR03_ENTTH|nr:MULTISPECIES: hypothetical protein [Enterococcus]ASZ07352.1 hypothetical protein CK496_05315 [Enterococcus thailandicus]MDT2752103.1 hypothetical protein [Enterococcus thailandicus]MDT2777019.1 hypothetical protein [Enterococcus thailandicus]MDT2793994.1 hypothetical protein [Enterococcus thailandicus]OJG95669.1 hypothetical protein RV17_GL001516 [Enterococcus thailandicus]
MLNAKLRKNAIDNYNTATKRYEKIAITLSDSTNTLYEERKKAVKLVKLVEERINQLANTPKEFKVTLQKIEIEIENFKIKQNEIKKAEVEAKVAAGSTGTGVTLSALGLAVATMGPTAAMGIATTFGLASTGTAISTLSGAAATNAALAWLGGGALAAGGGGMSAGGALLALAGPVGWTIAGVMLVGSVGSGLFTSHKNKEIADKVLAERENLEKIIRNFTRMNIEVKALIGTTRTQIKGVSKAYIALDGNDYCLFSKDEKMQAGLLVNSTLTLAQIINKELKLDA